ncbi:MAG: FitA-like ribbon-helix-helix domain-containing protein [Candidatus Kapaibacterium sp.]
MKSLTIHNIDTDLYEAICLSARKNRRSLDQEIKDKLEKQYLAKGKKTDLKKFLNLWDESDYQEFKDNTKDTASIDKEDWV